MRLGTTHSTLLAALLGAVFMSTGAAQASDSDRLSRVASRLAQAQSTTSMQDRLGERVVQHVLARPHFGVARVRGRTVTMQPSANVPNHCEPAIAAPALTAAPRGDDAKQAPG
jgi:hypothetical protein